MGFEINHSFSFNIGGAGGFNPLNLFGGGNETGNGQPAGNQQGQPANQLPEDFNKFLMGLCQQACGGGNGDGQTGVVRRGNCTPQGGAEQAGGAEQGGGIQQILQLLMKLLQMIMGGGLGGAQNGGAEPATGAAQPAA
jgi:hypothetical protein